MSFALFLSCHNEKKKKKNFAQTWTPNCQEVKTLNWNDQNKESKALEGTGAAPSRPIRAYLHPLICLSLVSSTLKKKKLPLLLFFLCLNASYQTGVPSQNIRTHSFSLKLQIH